jgi:hypothetical protein
MRLPTPLGTALAALVLSAACSAAQSATPARTAQTGFREMTFDDFTRHHFLRDLPVHFVIPADYVALSNPQQVDRTYWTSRTDSAEQAKNPEWSLKDGFYSVQLSMSVGYDQGRQMFASSDMDETGMKAEYEKGGFTNVTTERYEVNGYPVLFLEADKDGRHAMLVYVAALVETNTIVAFYSQAHVGSDVDRQRRDALKQGILGSGPLHRIR